MDRTDTIKRHFDLWICTFVSIESVFSQYTNSFEFNLASWIISASNPRLHTVLSYYLACLVSFYRMAFPCVRLCTRHMRLQVSGYATLSKASRPQENSSTGPVFQYVGQHRKPSHKVFVWGFSFTGALGIPGFVVPDSGRKKPRKYQLTPYRLETSEQVKSAFLHWGLGSLKYTVHIVSFHTTIRRVMYFTSDKLLCFIAVDWKM